MAKEGNGELKNIPNFPSIQPSLENISDLLSIIGANANVVKINKDTCLKKGELFGCIGFGPVEEIFSCKLNVERHNFFHLDMKKNSDVSFALINITYPDAFDGGPNESLSKVGKIEDAAFAQHFISRIEVKKKTDRNVPLSLCFALVFRNKKVYLLSGSRCWDETVFFQENVWSMGADEHTVASFKTIFKNHSFKEGNGRLFAVLRDEKLRIQNELNQLQHEYSKKYGSYDNDKTMSKEDWANVSAMNANILEAESFELVIEGPKGRRTSGVSTCHDEDSTAENERYEMFCKIKATERKLWAEQEKFKYSMIPGRDVTEARKEFFNQFAVVSRSSSPVTSTRTPFAMNTKHNLLHRKCLSTGHDRQNLKRKTLFKDNNVQVTPRRSKRLLRT